MSHFHLDDKIVEYVIKYGTSTFILFNEHFNLGVVRKAKWLLNRIARQTGVSRN